MIDYNKFLRNYSLAVERQDGTTLTITPPISMEFDITRNTYESLNVASIRLFNLSQTHRNQIRFDVINVGVFRGFSLNAGYGTNLPNIFLGNITQAWSFREGNNFITQIESFDGQNAVTNAYSTHTFPANTPLGTVVSTVAGDLKTGKVNVGAIGGSYTGTIGNRGIPVDSPSWNWLKEITGGQAFIDKQKAFFLADSECRQGQLQIIEPSTGLLGTPLREQYLVSIEMLFEPRVVVGQLITLKSFTDASNFNGQYKVIGVKHRGTISPSVCGDALTSLKLQSSKVLTVVTEQ